MKHLIEESYEVVEAVEAPGGPEAHRDELVEELGDVLLQVVFHARIAQERSAQQGGFDVDDVVAGISEKLVRRHPEVFADGQRAEASDDAALHARWEELKRAEKPQRTGPFDGVPPGLPALQRTESRGGHTRDDHPKMDSQWRNKLLVCRTVDGAGDEPGDPVIPEVSVAAEPQPPMRPDLLATFELSELEKYYTAEELLEHPEQKG